MPLAAQMKLKVHMAAHVHVIAATAAFVHRMSVARGMTRLPVLRASSCAKLCTICVLANFPAVCVVA